MRGPIVACALLSATSALADEAACSDRPGGEVFAFEAPPPPPEALQRDLRAGRAYLRSVGKQARSCGDSAPELTAGYAVATLRPGRLTFSAPEGLQTAALRCLGKLGRRLQTPPPLPPGAEVRMVWVLREPAPPPQPSRSEAPPQGKRSFAEIEGEVKRHLPAITACLEELWAERPHAAGTLALRLTVPEHGVVEGAEVLRREPSMAAAEPCLTTVFARLRLPPRWGAGRSVLSYPILLAPAAQQAAAN